MTKRRDFVKTLVAGTAAVVLLPRSLSRGSASGGSRALKFDRSALLFGESIDDPWVELPKILARIKTPTFPARDFKITDYGAKPDGSDSTESIRRAVEACHAGGGGRVVVPPGVFTTGAVHLKSNVNLHISEGATLKFSTDPVKYLPVVFTRFEGTE